MLRSFDWESELRLNTVRGQRLWFTGFLLLYLAVIAGIYWNTKKFPDITAEITPGLQLADTADIPQDRAHPYTVTGTIENTSAAPFVGVQIAFAVFDDQYEPVGQAKTTLTNLAPNETRSFKAQAIVDPHNPPATRFRLELLTGVAGLPSNPSR